MQTRLSPQILIGIVFLLLLGGFSGARPRPTIVIEDCTNGCVIEKPNVRQRLTDYANYQFQPGDTVTLDAGGCVQTAGKDIEYNDYVHSYRPDSERLHHGLVWIPGVTPGLVRLEGWIHRPLLIPLNSGIDPSELHLRLGYESDNYEDNNYDTPTNVTDGPCTGSKAAWVKITVTKGATQPPPQPITPLPFDIVWKSDQVDDNWLPLNPEWATPLPDTSPIQEYAGLSKLTTQSPSVDNPGDSFSLNNPTGPLKAPLSELGAKGHPVIAHVNWFPVTCNGTIEWEGHPWSDEDINLHFTPKDPKTGMDTTTGLALGRNDLNKTIGLEFDSQETTDKFTTPWWAKFSQQLNYDDNNSQRVLQSGDRELLANKSKVAPLVKGLNVIVTGLKGLDCGHPVSDGNGTQVIGVELHPVYAMAIQTDASDNEKWAFFVRTSGNEGYLSRDQHYMDLIGNRYTFRFPWKKGATEVTWVPNIVASPCGIQYEIKQEKDAVLLTVHFGEFTPEQHPIVHGEIMLKWK